MAKIVVADLDSTTHAALAPGLAARGHEIVPAADAYAAATAAELERAVLVVVSHQIPSGGSIKAIEWLRAKPVTKNTPAIILSSIFDPSIGVLEGPLIRILEKPIDLARFEAIVDEFLGKAGPARVAAADPIEEDAPLENPTPGGAPPRSAPMDMGAPSDDDLPTGDTIELDL
jgi:DNA-binding response OmpR family regulator